MLYSENSYVQFFCHFILSGTKASRILFTGDLFLVVSGKGEI